MSGSNGVRSGAMPVSESAPQRRAVVGDPARDHLVAVAEALELVVLLDELDDRLVRLGAAGDEEDAVQVARRQLGDLPGELDRARVGVVPVRVERQLGHLLRGRLAQLRAEAVADLGAEEPGEPVEVLLAVRVVEPSSPRRGEMTGTSSVSYAALAREVHQEMALRERLELGVVGHAWRSFRGVAAHRIVQGTALTASDRGRPLYSPAHGFDRGGIDQWPSSTGTSSEALRAKRDRYVARGVSIAPIFASARPRRPADRRRRARVHRLRRRHRRAQPGPHARRGGRGDQPPGRRS